MHTPSSRFSRGRYSTHPVHTITSSGFLSGYRSLAQSIRQDMATGLRVLAIDGYHGVDWQQLKNGLENELQSMSITSDWISMEQALKSPDHLREMLKPFLDEDDPIFGFIWPTGIEAFFEPAALAQLRTLTSIERGAAAGKVTIIYGIGSGLIDTVDSCWYAEVSKEHIQYLKKTSSLRNWGDDSDLPFGAFYKRAYYIEWPALNRHKRALHPRVDCYIDMHQSEHPVAIEGDAFRSALHQFTHTPFRPRPWFAPGPWGGQFMKHHMGLDPNEPNYAWSFELIAPENGVCIGDGKHNLEFAFDWLLIHDGAGVMGSEAFHQFGIEWPIRFDYLDTMDGGSLSVQVHPRPDYIRREFGETFTQDETYYIALADQDSKVYLGFKDETQPEEFKKALQESAEKGLELDVDRYVHLLPSQKHDLFMIPNGTIHCSGKGNLVLEISATPYIYTFKLYDYLRRDLHGNLRPINIDRGFDNLYWDRRSDWVNEHLVAKPNLVTSGPDWQEWVLMDVSYTFYVIHRVDFETSVEWEIDDTAYMINLVEGESVDVIGENGIKVPLSYLESMVVPARTGNVRCVNTGKAPCKLMKVYVRKGLGSTHSLNVPK